MLERPGDLIPVQPHATSIPWTRRRSQILNFLHRGPVTFSTLVYDTNVGDISALATYFNPDRISERELNLRFGHYPTSGEKHASPQKGGSDSVIKPRLLLYPDHNLNSSQVKVQRTLNWVLSQDSNAENTSVQQESGQPRLGLRKPMNVPLQPMQSGVTGFLKNVPGDGRYQIQSDSGEGTASSDLLQDITNDPLDIHPSRADQYTIPFKSKSVTMPSASLTSALDSVWTEKGVGNVVDPLVEQVENGLGLGGLATRVSKSSEVLDKLDAGDRWWGAWDTAHSW